MNTPLYKIYDPETDRYIPDAWVYPSGNIGHDTIYQHQLDKMVICRNTGMFDEDDNPLFEYDVVEYRNSRENIYFDGIIKYSDVRGCFEIDDNGNFPLYDKNDYYGHFHKNMELENHRNKIE